MHERSWYENGYSVVRKEKTDFNFNNLVTGQEKKNHTMRTCNGYARGRDLVLEIEENIQVNITFISSFCCLSFYNYLLLLNVQFIFGLNYHSLFVACWCSQET